VGGQRTTGAYRHLTHTFNDVDDMPSQEVAAVHIAGLTGCARIQPFQNIIIFDGQHFFLQAPSNHHPADGKVAGEFEFMAGRAGWEEQTFECFTLATLGAARTPSFNHIREVHVFLSSESVGWAGPGRADGGK
jgi:hypothetical protein